MPTDPTVSVEDVIQLAREWRPVVGYEGLYSVSSDGQVRRDTASRGRGAGHIMHQHTTRRMRTTLTKDGDRCHCYVHILVAAAFIGARPAGCEINHKDGNWRNNCYTNLEYITPEQNLAHSLVSGLQKWKLTERQRNEISCLARAMGTRKVAGRYGISVPYVRDIKSGRTKRRRRMSLTALAAAIQEEK